jgi:hypothetical protein
MARPASAPTPGLAVVVALRATGQVTELTLRHASGERTLLLVPTAADPAAARRTSRHGPVQRPVSLPSALALCAAGVHTVVVVDGND